LAAPPRSKHPSDPGTTSVAHLEENVSAAKLNLTQDQLQQFGSVAGGAN
jgi:aryl-alcohol dehydrogenase-like predicted oxidoreductase